MRSTLGDPDLRSLSGFDSGLRPPLRMTQGGDSLAKEVRIYVGFPAFFRFRICAGIPALFFSFQQIKKPSPVGEGGPRQWWMRSPRDRLTYIRHLIRQPSAATFSHWRRLSFVYALYGYMLIKNAGDNHCIMVVERHKSAPSVSS